MAGAKAEPSGAEGWAAPSLVSRGSVSCVGCVSVALETPLRAARGVGRKDGLVSVEAAVACSLVFLLQVP